MAKKNEKCYTIKLKKYLVDPKITSLTIVITRETDTMDKSMI